MIRPVNFSFNQETAVNNAFQVNGNDEAAQAKALKEFDDFAALLKKNGVDLIVIDDTPEPYTPDSIFPNNWVSFHNDGSILLYPMYAVNRRSERKTYVLDQIAARFSIKQKIDLSRYENENSFLEGTGSMVLDRDQKIAYACLSPRTHEKVLADFCRRMHYTPVMFHAADEKNMPIYHTNVMMCVADRYVVICLDAIASPEEKEAVAKVIQQSGKELIAITLEQMNQFAGNMLQIENHQGEKLLVMSTRAFDSLTPAQKEKLGSFNRIIHAPLTTIETNGGGSARCMMAEIHLPAL